MAGALERSVGIAGSFIRVSLLIWALGQRQYGIYVATLGVVSSAGLLDFGLQYGVVNAVAHARGGDDSRALREIMASAWLLYAGIAAGALVLLVGAINAVPVDGLFQTSGADTSLVRHVLLAGFAGLLLGFPLRVVRAALTGLQEQHVVSSFRAFAPLANLGAVVAAALLAPGHLLPVVVASTAVDLALSAGFNQWIARRRPELRIEYRCATWTRAKDLFGASLTFLVTNLANLFKVSLGATLIAHLLGPDTAPSFSVPLALFVAAMSFSDLFAASLWPGIREASVRGDWDWVDAANALGTKISLSVAGFFAVLGLAFGRDVVNLWSHGVVLPGHPLLAWMALWLMGQVCIMAAATLLNGLGRQRVVMGVVLLEGGLGFGLGYFLVPRFGPAALAATMAGTGVVSASILIGLAPKMSGGRVRAPASAIVRVLPTTAIAAVVGLVLERNLVAFPSLVRVALGAPLTAAVYASLAWLTVASAADRVRVRSWATRQKERLG